MMKAMQTMTILTRPQPQPQWSNGYSAMATSNDWRHKKGRGAVKPSRRGKSCRKDCHNYPCFKGIDSLESNLCLFCKNFRQR